MSDGGGLVVDKEFVVTAVRARGRDVAVALMLLQARSIPSSLSARGRNGPLVSRDWILVWGHAGIIIDEGDK